MTTEWLPTSHPPFYSLEKMRGEAGIEQRTNLTFKTQVVRSWLQGKQLKEIFFQTFHGLRRYTFNRLDRIHFVIHTTQIRKQNFNIIDISNQTPALLPFHPPSFYFYPFVSRFTWFIFSISLSFHLRVRNTI